MISGATWRTTPVAFIGYVVSTPATMAGPPTATANRPAIATTRGSLNTRPIAVATATTSQAASKIQPCSGRSATWSGIIASNATPTQRGIIGVRPGASCNRGGEEREERIEDRASRDPVHRVGRATPEQGRQRYDEQRHSSSAERSC